MLFGPEGARIAYEVTGSGPPLLLVHGFTASRASFLENVASLARHFTVINTELLGHGDSDAPLALEPYGPGPAVERLAALTRSLGFERFLLCGHSLGGALGLRFALDHPGRLSGLVIINSNSAAGTVAWREQARAGMRAMAARVRRDGVAAMRDSWLYPARSTRLPAAAREALQRDFDRLTPQGLANTAEALVCDVNCAERLHELRVPTLYVFGDRDRQVGESLPGFLARLPAGLVELVTLEGAGHAANLERPREFEAALLAFSRRLSWQLRASG